MWGIYFVTLRSPVKSKKKLSPKPNQEYATVNSFQFTSPRINTPKDSPIKLLPTVQKTILIKPKSKKKYLSTFRIDIRNLKSNDDSSSLDEKEKKNLIQKMNT
jgi:hypothetical protein